MNKASYLKQYEHLNNQINHLLEEKRTSRINSRENHTNIIRYAERWGRF